MMPRFSDVRVRQFGWALAISTLAGALGAGRWLGLEVAVLVLAAGALVLVIALLWASAAGLSGDTPLTLDEAIGMGAPSTEEEQKRAVLRALKDLEYERSVGKLSDADYHEFSERYRAEARRLIEAVDATLGPAQELAEKLARDRLDQAGLSDPPPPPSLRSAGDGSAPGPEKSKETAENSGKPPEPPKPKAAARSADSEALGTAPQEGDS
jgi:hypothetical protein